MVIENEAINVKIMMDYLESMNPWDFEILCAQALPCYGFVDVEVTQGSGDHGVDIIGKLNGNKWAIQCKRYTSNRYAGNNGIWEVYNGGPYYNCTHGAVLTTTLFTDLSKMYAAQLGVHLWDRYWLYYLMSFAIKQFRTR